MSGLLKKICVGGVASLALLATTKSVAAAAPAVLASAAVGQVGGGTFVPPGEDPRVAAMTDDRQAKARRYMQQAWAALRQNNTVEATALYRQAAATGAQFAPGEDSPERLAEELQRRGVRLDLVAPIPYGPQPLRRDGSSQVGADRLGPRTPAALPGRGGPFDAAVEDNPYAIDARGGAPPLVDGPPRGESAVDPVKMAQARRLIAQTRLAMDRGELPQADAMLEQAEGLRIPPEAFRPDEMHPWKLRLELDATLRRGAVVPAGGAAPSGSPSTNPYPDSRFPGARPIYQPERDPTRVIHAQAEEEGGGARRLPDAGGSGSPEELIDRGMKALADGDTDAARRMFQQAWRYRDQLDPPTVQMLQDRLVQLGRPSEQVPPGREPSPLDAAEAERQLIQQKMQRQIMNEQAAAERMREENPRAALARLHALRDRVASDEQLEPGIKGQLVAVVDRSIQRMDRYIQENLADIELAEQNAGVIEELNLDRAMTSEVRNKLAELVDEFNKLMDQQRYPEAEVLARQARELAPDEAVVQTMMWKVRFVRRFEQQMAISEQSEEGFYLQLTSAAKSSIPFNDNEPYQLPDARTWRTLSATRRRWLEDQQQRLSPAEIEIQNRLQTPVEISFTNHPLADVMAILAKAARVNVYLDPEGMAAEGVTSDTPVTINLTQQISMKSALNLILQPLHLGYVVDNEVLRITSEQTQETKVYPLVYNVADLVIPIPNFIPSYNIGLPGAIREAHNALGYGGRVGPAGPGPLTFAVNDQAEATNPLVLAQMAGSSQGGRAPQPVGYGPGGTGGGTLADFDSLIDLIITTIAPESWDDVGGPGSVSGFEGNLSLVVSQTQEIHEQIADLLEQLRRLQDLQVTIEVRFITLNDNFFERIGVDFDFDIDDRSGLVGDGMGGFQTPPGPPPDDGGPSRVIGLDALGSPTADLDLVFNQDSFGSAVPQFGGFDAMTAANFGFAILSDIEVFFLLQASQGDQRSNVMQAPKVTLFNGQQAFVSDTSQTPFVTSIIPVVGDFAAAHQPVIVVLSEGTSLSVQAVVSNDRRFVRLTLVPFFSKIDSVQEFTFDGETTQDSGTIVTDPTGALRLGRNNEKVTTKGSTVQLPTFSFTTVTTTVSVPDGGTVLLGGIKRLSEGRTERGVPLLSKIPYINRLFKNIGIGRTTQSLMMMVTPRIIIQEEEEERTVGRPL